MHEIKMLITVTIAIAVILWFVVGYYMRQAKAKKQDPSIALRNGLFAALAIFALFIVMYENNREKKAEAEARWCEEHPIECREKAPALRY